MLETFTLKQHLDATRQELSQALYQHDAACRVIARLMRERDEAHSMIAALQANHPQTANSVVNSTQLKESHPDKMVVEESVAPVSDGSDQVISAEVIAEINSKCAELSGRRKGRKPSDKLASKDAVSSFVQLSSLTPHKADSKTGVTCVAVRASFGEESPSTVILSGSSDKSAILTEQASGKVLAKLAGHTKKVTAVSFHGTASTALITASADKTVKVCVVTLPSNRLFGNRCSLILFTGRFGTRRRLASMQRRGATLATART